MKSHRKIFSFSTLDTLQSKNLSYLKINSVNPLHLVIDKINQCIEESNRYKYFTLVPTDKSKDTVKIYEEMWSKVSDLIR